MQPKMFLHSLVRVKRNKKNGWCAPAELKGDVPHYISFALPLDQGEFSKTYTCEVVKLNGSNRTLESQELLKVGSDSFLIEPLEGVKIWFTVLPTSNKEQPYIGSLKHQDFKHPFREIEPEDPAALDKLCDNMGMFIIGCDPFTHYGGLSSPSSIKRRS